MTSFMRAALAAAVGLAVAGSTARAVPGPQSASIDSRVMLTSQSNLEPLSAIRPDGLEASSDGAAVAITGWRQIDEPLDVAVLIDLSWSGRYRAGRYESVLEAAIDSDLVRPLGPDDHVRIGTFAGERRLSAPFPGGATEWPADARAVFDVPVESRYGPSPIWDAVEAAVTAMAHESGQRLIILATDGQGTGNWTPRPDALRDAELADVSISMLPDALATTAAILRTASESTGGLYPFAPPPASIPRYDRFGRPVNPDPVPLVGGTEHWFAADPAPMLRAIVDGARHSWRLSFQPPSLDGQIHSLLVRSRAPDVVVHARRFYRACMAGNCGK